jgi:rfaE bifunctional protein nucleotidyltransferase chain/domain
MNSQNNIGQKILSLEVLAGIVQKLKAENHIVVLCHGVFDLIHPGHIRHFDAAKREGDILVVTVTPDRFVNKGPGRPVFNERLRTEALAALCVVDYVAINEWPTAEETIRKLRPDVYVKGSEYSQRKNDLTGKIYDEEEAILSVGGRIHFTEDITFSSTKLLNTYFNILPPEAEMYLSEFRQSYNKDDIISRLKALHSMRVLVIGDTIIDEYHFCQALGKSSKSNSLNSRFLHAEAYAGGALAISNHIAGFCNSVHLVSCIGQAEPWLEFITTHLKPNISTKFFTRPDGPTTVKRRYVESFLYQKMFEVTFSEDRPLPADVAANLNSYLAAIASEYDLVVAGDFGHGLIGRDTVDVLCSKAKFLAVNAQTNSVNTGYNLITKYPRADYVCVDQEEIRLAYHDRFGPLDLLIKRAAEQLSASILTVTQGHHGSTTYRRNAELVRTPAFSKEVVDTLGAGDAYLSVTAPCAAAGYPPKVIGFIGNAVGALAIQILGNRESVEPVPLFKFIDTLLK